MVPHHDARWILFNLFFEMDRSDSRCGSRPYLAFAILHIILDRFGVNLNHSEFYKQAALEYEATDWWVAEGQSQPGMLNLNLSRAGSESRVAITK